MSIDINWSLLTSNGSSATDDASADDLALSIRDFIHDKFQQVELPRFLRSVEVHTFSFGSSPPSLTIQEITDPFDEFYEDEGSDEDEQGSMSEEGSPSPTPKRKNPDIPSQTATQSHLTPSRSGPGQAMLPPLTTQLHNPHTTTNSLFSPSLSSLNRAPPGNPGIPGGTSNLSYFHLPNTSLSGSTTPNPFPAAALAAAHLASPTSSYHHHNRPPSPPTSIPQTPLDRYTDPVSPPTTTTQPSSSQAHPQDPQQQGLEAETGPSAAGGRRRPNERNPLDLQIVAHLAYSGDVGMSLTAEILLDYPMPSFVGIPLKLRITGCRFDGVGVGAYLHGRKVRGERGRENGVEVQETGEGEGERGRGKVKVCFLAPEDARVLVGEEGVGNVAGAEGGNQDGGPQWRGEGVDGKGEGVGSGEKTRFGGLLEEIRVESEIGRQADGKQVLKNVGKVERFVLEQVRRIFEEEFVWPSWWTFLV